MRLRVFIINTSEAVRDSLAMHIESLGHEAVVAEHLATCPHYHEEHGTCSQQFACGDAVIFGQELPDLNGIDLVERRLKGGCKGAAANNALLCRPWSEKARSRCAEIGCRFFETPLPLSEVTRWLDEIAARLPAGRTLAPLAELRP